MRPDSVPVPSHCAKGSTGATLSRQDHRVQVERFLGFNDPLTGSASKAGGSPSGSESLPLVARNSSRYNAMHGPAHTTVGLASFSFSLRTSRRDERSGA
jgi:hypothetical protein